MKYISLLRGINVSGQKKIKMVDLAKLYESLKFKNVQTYIQSGNVVFEYHEWKTEPLAGAIKKAIQKKYGFEVEIIIRTEKDWPKIITSNPFIDEALSEPKFVHVFLLSSAPEKSKSAQLQSYCQAGEKYQLKGSELYVVYPSGAGKSKLLLSIIEKKLGVAGTARNWLTMQTLGEMCA